LIDKKKSKLDQEIYTVVQPDLCIFDDAKIDERGAIGVSDLVIEILSPKFQ
jgi:Uma2 family endonuclease